MAKDDATALPVLTSAAEETGTLKGAAKPKGWKKWTRRLSHVFKGKKKGKKSKKSPVNDPSTRKPSHGSTDESPTGSEKEGDRTDSREWRLEAGGHERWSGESGSAREPTDEEWEAEQRRLAYQAEDEEEELEYEEEGEYEDEELADYEDVSKQSEGEQEREEAVVEDVHEYTDGELEGLDVAHAGEVAISLDEYGDECAAEGQVEEIDHENSISLLAIACDNSEDAPGELMTPRSDGEAKNVDENDALGQEQVFTNDEDAYAQQEEEPTEENEYEEPAPSILAWIPEDMTLLQDVAAWCGYPETVSTVETRLFMASLAHHKWPLAQLLAEKLLRDYGETPTEPLDTETVLDAILTHCAA